MSSTAWTATRQELVAALQKARLDAATAQAVAAELEARERTRKARLREAAAAKRERDALEALEAAREAARTVPPDPFADHHRKVLEQALEGFDDYRKGKKP